MTATVNTVRFMKRVNLGNYEHEEAEHSIQYVPVEGSDFAEVLAEAGELAKNAVLELLLGKREAVGAIEQPAVESLPGPLVSAPPSTSAAISTLASVVEPNGAASNPSAISDADLVTAVTNCNGRLQLAKGEAAAPMIRELVAKFVAPPGTVRQCPPEKRAALLKALAELV